MADWQNWSGSVQGRPAEVYRPTALAELQAIIARAAKVRVVGAGHSFMPLCETDGSLLQLGQLDVPLEIAPNRKTVWAPAGWGLNRLTKTLWDEGLSLINQGDINPQALAGAIATGTHGTGAELGSMSTAARAFRFVGPSGEILTCSATEAPNLFAAQRLSLGMMGVVTQIEIDVLPAYYLEQKIRKVPLAQAVEEFDDLAATHRHAEFFVFPYSDEVILKTLHPTDEQRPARDPNPNEDDAFQICCDIGRALPFLIGPLQRFMMRAIGSHRKIGPAYSIFPSERAVRFEEMEYEMPRAAGLSTLVEAITWMRKARLPVAFPFEFRWTAADDLWLSPFNKGPGASISMHQYARMSWRKLFVEGEAIFQGAGGRPHWAKRHTLSRADVDRLYPQAEAFRAERRALDPDGKFLNAHLTELFS